MTSDQIMFKPIGTLHTPHLTAKGAPIQPSGARDVKGTATIHPEFQEGLKDLEGFSHIVLLYHCHLIKQVKLKVVPFLDNQPRGVFATRAPARPNCIGMSVVRLEKVEDNILYLLDVDMLDGTPLLDIKPHVAKFDQPKDPVRVGWLEEVAQRSERHKGDERFLNE
jgi:tRNA-Thr(GGU) m(6)t(6)A37 methyltransferase TsaA